MKLTLYPSMPNTKRVRELRDFRWDVTFAGRALSLAFGGREPLAEVRLAGEPVPPVWQGDVLVLSDRGEFAIAVGRGFILSVEAERLSLPDAGLDREERLLKSQAGGLELRLYFEWGDDLRWRRLKEGLVGVSSPGADYPLMVFIAAAGTAALVDTEIDRIKSLGMGDVVAMTQSFASAQPRLEMTPRIDALYEHAHHLHRINSYEPEPPFIYEWECPTRADRYLSRVSGNLDTLHAVWDWILIDPMRARQEFENYLKGYDPVTCQIALDVAPMAEDLWPSGPRIDTEGRAMLSSHPPLWADVAWRLYSATGDLSWLKVTYEIAKLNVGWWERERDRDGDGLFEWADTRFPQPWESGCDGSPRFDEITADGFACIDLNAQMAMFYASLVRFATELGEAEAAAEFRKRRERLAVLINERLWDAKSGWYYDFGEEGLVKALTTAGLWAINAGVAGPAQIETMLDHVTNDVEFATWFPLPTVAASDPRFELVGARGPSRPFEALWLAMGLRQAGRIDLAGKLVRRALDAMADVLAKDGAVWELYSPHGSDPSGLKLFDIGRAGEPTRRDYAGNSPIRAMLLYGLIGIEPTAAGLTVSPAAESMEKNTRVDFILGKQGFVLEAMKRREGMLLTIRRGRKTLAEGYGRLSVPRSELA